MIKKSSIITIIIVLLIVALSISLILYFFFSTITITKLSDYEQRKTHFPESAGVLPKLEELSDYISIDYEYRRENFLFFTTYTLRLNVTYDKLTYENEKAKLGEKNYLDHTVKYEYMDEISNGCLIPEFEFFINSYNFRTLQGEMFYYPKSIGFIATSDEKNSIAYLYFYDYDLDYISEADDKGSMEIFIKKHFKYNW